MESWRSLDLGDGVQAYWLTQRIVKACAASVTQDGWVAECGVFSRYVWASGTFIAFFTPAAETLALKFGALACGKPSAKDLRLIAGERHLLDAHFPHRIQRPSGPMPGDTDFHDVDLWRPQPSP
jgi:hypothetical protein